MFGLVDEYSDIIDFPHDQMVFFGSKKYIEIKRLLFFSVL